MKGGATYSLRWSILKKLWGWIPHCGVRLRKLCRLS